MICINCGSKKESRYCNKCNDNTPSFFSKEFSESFNMKYWSKNLMKSGERVAGKPKREIEQYVGNKDKNVVSEFERLRERGKQTKVTHRLWRRFGSFFKKEHEHNK